LILALAIAVVVATAVLPYATALAELGAHAARRSSDLDSAAACVNASAITTAGRDRPGHVIRRLLGPKGL